MLFESSLWTISACVTFLVQGTLVYLTARAVCAFMIDPRLRLRVWGLFLFVAALAWAWVCAFSAWGSRVQLASGGAPFADGALHGHWTVDRSWDHVLSSSVVVLQRAYFLLVGLLCLEWQWKSLRLRNLLRTGHAPSSELQSLFQSICRDMAVTGCDLQLIPDLRSPASCGLSQPHVLLPDGLVPQLSVSQLTDILRHELTHIQRRDHLWDRLVALCCRILFFHPAVWLGLRRLRWERELACDDLVSESSESRLQYAECLLKLARWLYLAGRSVPDGVGFSSSSSLLAARVRALVRSPRTDSLAQQIARFGAVALVVSASMAVLPRVRVTLHPRIASVLPSELRLRAASPVVKRTKKVPRKVDQRAAPQLELYSGPGATDQLAHREPAIPSLDIGVRPLPVLEATTSPETASEEPQVLEGESGTSSWDENPAGGSKQTAPSWRSLGLHAATAAIGVTMSPDDGDKPTPRTRVPASRPH